VGGGGGGGGAVSGVGGEVFVCEGGWWWSGRDVITDGYEDAAVAVSGEESQLQRCASPASGP